MFDWQVALAITVLGIACYALRVSGFLAAGSMAQNDAFARFLQKAPGNLLVAFVAAACLENRWPGLIGCASGLAVMAVTKKEWLALAAGFCAAASAAFLI